MVKYIIDNKVIFYPEEKQLSTLKSGVTVTVLNSSAQCLELLIQRQGELVTHGELMVAGWGEDAIRKVSNSAYYQSFVSLRKILKKAGCPDNLLLTSRGRGIRLNAYIEVKEVDCNLHEQTGDMCTQSDGSEVDKKDLLANSNYVPDTPFLESRNDNATSLSKQKKIKSKYLMAFFFVIICFVFYFLYFYIVANNNFLNDYAHLNGTPDCYFVNSRNVNNKFAIDYIYNKGLACENGIKYYVSYYSTSPRLTVFACGKDASLKCDSITYIIDEDEKN